MKPDALLVTNTSSIPLTELRANLQQAVAISPACIISIRSR